VLKGKGVALTPPSSARRGKSPGLLGGGEGKKREHISLFLLARAGGGGKKEKGYQEGGKRVPFLPSTKKSAKCPTESKKGVSLFSTILLILLSKERREQFAGEGKGGARVYSFFRGKKVASTQEKGEKKEEGGEGSTPKYPQRKKKA